MTGVAIPSGLADLPISRFSFNDYMFYVGLSVAYLAADFHGDEIALAFPVPEGSVVYVEFFKHLFLRQKRFMRCADHYGQPLLLCFFNEEMSEFLELFALEGESESGDLTLDKG